MKDSDIVKIKKLSRISEGAIKFFVVAGIASMAIAIVGGFLAGIIEGIMDSKGLVRITLAFFGFVAASSAFSCGLSAIIRIWITVIQVKAKSLTLRLGISSFVANGFALLITIVVFYGAIWWGLTCLIDSGVVGIIK